VRSSLATPCGRRVRRRVVPGPLATVARARLGVCRRQRLAHVLRTYGWRFSSIFFPSRIIVHRALAQDPHRAQLSCSDLVPGLRGVHEGHGCHEPVMFSRGAPPVKRLLSPPFLQFGYDWRVQPLATLGFHARTVVSQPRRSGPTPFAGVLIACAGYIRGRAISSGCRPPVIPGCQVPPEFCEPDSRRGVPTSRRYER